MHEQDQPEPAVFAAGSLCPFNLRLVWKIQEEWKIQDTHRFQQIWIGGPDFKTGQINEN